MGGTDTNPLTADLGWLVHPLMSAIAAHENQIQRRALRGLLRLHNSSESGRLL
jgi:hypothetical protein